MPVDLVVADTTLGHVSQLINLTGGGSPTPRPGYYVGEIKMRSGDQLPMLAVAIEDDLGVPINLGGATDCSFVLRNLDGKDPRVVVPSGQMPAVHLVLPAFIADPLGGIVSFDWGLDSNLRPGTLEVAVVVNTPGGDITAPTDRTARITMRPNPFAELQGDGMEGRYDLVLYRGDSYAWRFRMWSDPARSVPTDLTGASAKAEIRNAPGGVLLVALDCSITLPNLIDVTLDPADSSRLPALGVWDLQVTFADGTVKTPVAGNVSTTADVTDSTRVVST